MMTLSRRFASLSAAIALGAAMSMVAVDADARAGRGGSFGSRGSRTFSVPPTTQMSPRAPAPINRSVQPTQPQAAPGARPTTGGLFNRPGLLGGLAAGFLGAGLFGMLAGNGLFGGLGGISSMLGLLLQIGIVFLVGRWLYRMWQRRSTPAYAGGVPGGRSPLGSEPLRQAPASVPSTGGARGYGGAPGYSTAAANSAPAGGYAVPGDRQGGAAAASASQGGLFDPSRDKIGLQQQDLDAFERLLTEIQLAYGRQDIATLRRYVTPEVLGFMEQDLRADAEQGVVNRIDNIKLLDGDLSEAWRDSDADYATVAMRYGIEDTTVSRSNGEIVDRGPAEVTEYWTFAKLRGGEWQLSAVQPA